jgi:hypothetical protein
MFQYTNRGHIKINRRNRMVKLSRLRRDAAFLKHLNFFCRKSVYISCFLLHLKTICRTISSGLSPDTNIFAISTIFFTDMSFKVPLFSVMPLVLIIDSSLPSALRVARQYFYGPKLANSVILAPGP